jgi:hypothetical protein
VVLSEVENMQKALVTNQGPFQFVQLPGGFHLSGDEVFVKRVGRSVLLIPTTPILGI